MATKVFKNEAEIKKYFNKICAKSVDAVSDKLLKDFQKHLESTVYSVRPGQNVRNRYDRYYKRGGFYSGWVIKTEKFTHQIGDYVRSLVFDGSKLINYMSDNKNGNIAHGGRGYEDMRNAMDVILNDRAQNDYFSVNGGAKYLANSGKGYWDSYMTGLDTKVTKWFDEELNKYGIKRG